MEAAYSIVRRNSARPLAPLCKARLRGCGFHAHRLPLTRELSAELTEGETVDHPLHVFARRIFSLLPSKPAVLPPPSSEGGIGFYSTPLGSPAGRAGEPEARLRGPCGLARSEGKNLSVSAARCHLSFQERQGSSCNIRLALALTIRQNSPDTQMSELFCIAERYSKLCLPN